jgi:hypothetical protein
MPIRHPVGSDLQGGPFELASEPRSVQGDLTEAQASSAKAPKYSQALSSSGLSDAMSMTNRYLTSLRSIRS